mmetsp:Transcript_71645/g.115663  ORF Transcript_71645/g.115663 Transcript_71645/m.115663 type:complete len:268 (-) Transcript_71645:884-1687(-)
MQVGLQLSFSLLLLHSLPLLKVHFGQNPPLLTLCHVSLGSHLHPPGLGLESRFLVLLPHLGLHLGHLLGSGALRDDHLSLYCPLHDLLDILNLLLDPWGHRHSRTSLATIWATDSATWPAPATSEITSELCLEPHDLFLVLTNHGVLGVFVDLWLVLDALSTVGVPQRGQRLVVVVVSWTKVRNHHRLGVATKRVLQQPCELGVSVRDVRGLAVHKGRDDVPQRREREVDLRRLLEPIASGTCLALPLRARQVHHVQLAHPDVSLAS